MRAVRELRPAVHARDEPLRGEVRQIAADRHARDPEALGDVVDGDRVALFEKVEDCLMSLGLHGSSYGVSNHVRFN